MQSFQSRDIGSIACEECQAAAAPLHEQQLRILASLYGPPASGHALVSERSHSRGRIRGKTLPAGQLDIPIGSPDETGRFPSGA